MKNDQKITMSHGSGGNATRELVNELFSKYFTNEALDKMEDAAVLDVTASKLAYTTDSFVVTPLFFSGGDIGKLAVCGTVNDLLVMGSTPRYLTAGFILEEGLEIKVLEEVIASMAQQAKEAGVQIVAGDTKVIEGSGGMYINTSGIGFYDKKPPLHTANVKPGDIVLVSGSLGDHHACILSYRMKIKNNILSDCTTLNEMVKNLMDADIDIKAMRDITRGGLATVLNEIADASNTSIYIEEEKIPLKASVKSFCDILGLDPFYMGNEGKLICIVSPEHAQKALEIIRASRHGRGAAIIGTVGVRQNTGLVLNTRLGGSRILNMLHGEGLPRIC